MIQVAISLSVILGLLSSELLGIASGGLISAGYLALYFNTPLRLVSTLALGLLVYLVVRLLDQVIFLYGRRRFALCILLSAIGSWAVQQLLVSVHPGSLDLRIVGYIIPGLMANDMLKQGILKTLASVIVIAALVWLFTVSGFVR